MKLVKKPGETLWGRNLQCMGRKLSGSGTKGEAITEHEHSENISVGEDKNSNISLVFGEGEGGGLSRQEGWTFPDLPSTI